MFMIDMILTRSEGQAGRGESGREFFLRTTVGLSGCKSWNTLDLNASLQNQTCVKVMAKKLHSKIAHPFHALKVPGPKHNLKKCIHSSFSQNENILGKILLLE